jgi:hypothetical protein
MAKHHEKSLMDKKIFPEELIPKVITKQLVSAVNISIMDQCNQMFLENKKMDAFLDKVHKKKVSNEIRQRKQKKKLSQLHMLSQDLSSITSELFQADLSITNTKHALPEQVVKEPIPEESFLVFMKFQKIKEKQVNLSEIKKVKIPYN